MENLDVIELFPDIAFIVQLVLRHIIVLILFLFELPLGVVFTVQLVLGFVLDVDATVFGHSVFLGNDGSIRRAFVCLGIVAEVLLNVPLGRILAHPATARWLWLPDFHDKLQAIPMHSSATCTTTGNLFLGVTLGAYDTHNVLSFIVGGKKSTEGAAMLVNDFDLGREEGCLPKKVLGTAEYKAKKVWRFVVGIGVRAFVEVRIVDYTTNK